MCRRTVFFVLVFVVCVGLGGSAFGSLKVDFDGTDSGSNAGPTQEGFESIRSGTEAASNDAGNPIVTYPDAFGPGGDAVVNLVANRWKVRSNITSGDETAVALADLLRDFGAARGTDTATLTLTLPKGLYFITVYHHESNRSYFEDASMTLTDADGVRETVMITTGFDDNPATAPTLYEATLRSDGASDIVFVYVNDGASGGAFPINGFVLDSMMGSSDPSPANRTPDLQELDITLDWAVGPDPNDLEAPNANITGHYVYLGSGNPDDPNLYYTDYVPADGGTRASYGPLALDYDGTYTWRVDESVKDSGPGDPNTMKGKVWTFDTIKSIPVIGVQPQTVAVVAGDSATISIEVSSLSTPHYQWMKVGEPDTAVGDDSASYEILGVTVEDHEGLYYCNITNASGAPPVVSDIVGIGVKREVVYLPLDEDYLDDSGEGNDALATDPAAAVFVDGKIGQAVDMDAAGTAQIGTFNPSAFTDSVSVSLWINSDGSPDNLDPVSKRTANNVDGMMWTLQLRGTNSGGTSRQVRFRTSGGFDVYSGAEHQVIPGEWTHICATADGTTASVYVNGKLAATGDGKMGKGVDAPLLIGLQQIDSNVFLGLVDEVRIFNYDLGPEGVAQLYFNDTGETTCVYPSVFDTNDDCRVTLIDLADFAAEWLECGRIPYSECP
jgi:hypothetical protein